MSNDINKGTPAVNMVIAVCLIVMGIVWIGCVSIHSSLDHPLFGDKLTAQHALACEECESGLDNYRSTATFVLIGSVMILAEILFSRRNK